jgi:hypothetical protein
MKPCVTQGKAFHRLALPCCRRGRSPACTFRGFSSDANNVACRIASRAEEDARSGTERVVWVTSTPGCLGTNWEQTFSSLISLWSHISVVRFEFGIAASSASAPMSPICGTNKHRATCIQRHDKPCNSHATHNTTSTLQPRRCRRSRPPPPRSLAAEHVRVPAHARRRATATARPQRWMDGSRGECWVMAAYHVMRDAEHAQEAFGPSAVRAQITRSC